MIPIQEGELIVELCPVPKKCRGCAKPVAGDNFDYCPNCSSSNTGIQIMDRAGSFIIDQ